MRFFVQVDVAFKPSVFDPQGHAVEQAVHSLGYTTAADFRIGKSVTFSIEAADEPAARAVVEQISLRVLSNPVMERFTYHLTAAGDDSSGTDAVATPSREGIHR
ncbi:MAG: phosphoribosylformylglycinamidine synthase subunit PurS [Alicyclobacillus sp.]|nr:phosphoribosylformylglycinamidine synthase subunit PurS [Alicyclobacillus sp.]